MRKSLGTKKKREAVVMVSELIVAEKQRCPVEHECKSLTLEHAGAEVIGRIYVDDLDVSAEMVRRGATWVYRKYATDKHLYALEDEARADKRGLWGLPEAERMPPWEWRRR